MQINQYERYIAVFVARQHHHETSTTGRLFFSYALLPSSKMMEHVKTKASVYIAITVDGYIADKDGSSIFLTSTNHLHRLKMETCDLLPF